MKVKCLDPGGSRAGGRLRLAGGEPENADGEKKAGQGFLHHGTLSPGVEMVGHARNGGRPSGPG